MTNDAPGAPADPTGSCQSLAAALLTTAEPPRHHCRAGSNRPQAAALHR